MCPSRERWRRGEVRLGVTCAEEIRPSSFHTDGQGRREREGVIEGGRERV